MKVFIVLSALVVVVSAGGYGSGSSYGGGARGSFGGVMDGASSQYRSDDEYGNYRFGYDESHSTGGSSRQEEESNGVRRGSYSLSDADGRRRTVNYIADHTGFHATVDTNEPGTEAKSPADVIMNGAQPVSALTGYSGAVAQTASYSAPRMMQIAAPVAVSAYSAPAPIVRSTYSQAPLAMNTYSAAPAPLRIAAATYSSAPSAGYSTAQAQQYEAPTPRAFSYSFSSAHQAPMRSYSAAPMVAATYSAAPAPLVMRAYSAPAPAPLAINTYSSAPAPAPLRAYSAPIAATTYSAAPAQQQQYEAPTPRAFSYSFSSAHQQQSPIAASYSAAPLATGPITTYSANAPSWQSAGARGGY